MDGGKLPVKTDKEVTEDDIKTKNLILFGDPSSNSLIARAACRNCRSPGPKRKLTVAGQKYESEKYLPMLIYPNPLNPAKYIVLNSGHTFHDAEFRATNAMLFPRLGDYAVVRPLPTAKDSAAFEVMKGGIFDDDWKFAGEVKGSCQVRSLALPTGPVILATSNCSSCFLRMTLCRSTDSCGVPGAAGNRECSIRAFRRRSDWGSDGSNATMTV